MRSSHVLVTRIYFARCTRRRLCNVMNFVAFALFTFFFILVRGFKIQRCPVMYDLISPFPLLFIVFLCELSRSLPIFMFPLQQKHQRIRGNRILDVVPKAVALSSLSTPAEVQLTDEIVALRDCDSSLDGIRFLFDTYRPQLRLSRCFNGCKECAIFEAKHSINCH